MNPEHFDQVRQNVTRALRRYDVQAQLTFTGEAEFTVCAKTKGVLRSGGRSAGSRALRASRRVRFRCTRHARLLRDPRNADLNAAGPLRPASR